jgi:hypothetical protein
MTAEDAISFIREHGIVLASGKGAVPRLSEVIAGGPIKGSWWAHPKSHQIFAIFSSLARSPEILVCRVVDGKVTFVHRRLWAALARLAKEFDPARLAQVHEEHTRAGYHIKRDTPFPKWVPPEVMEQAQRLSEEAARDALGAFATRAAARPSRGRS